MKRNIIQFALILFGFSMCNISKKENSKSIVLPDDVAIEITIDTLDIQVGGEIEKAIYHQDKFITIFKDSDFKKKAKFNYKKMFLFKENGDIVNEVELPWKVKRLRLYDLKIMDKDLFFVRGDYLKDFNYRMDLSSFSFQDVEQEKYALFEDKDYEVFSSCYGEWGGTIFFRDKKSKVMYEVTATCTVKVNKIDNEYYLTNYLGHMSGSTSVLKISDPKKLKIVKERNAFDRSLEKHIKGYSFKGREIVFEAFMFKIWDSFIIDNKLMHLYINKEGTHIGEVKNGKIQSLYKFDFKFQPIYAYQGPKGKKVITFISEKEWKSGILVIENNKLNFYFIK
jgi:hypothetical protein